MVGLICYATYNQNRKSDSKQVTAVVIKKRFAFFLHFLACSRLRDSRVRWIEKAGFSRAFQFRVFPTLTQLERTLSEANETLNTDFVKEATL